MKRLLAISIASASIAVGAIPALAEVDPKIHKLCIEAKDYSGCAKTMSGDSESTFNPKMCDKYLGTLGNTYLNCLESSGAKFPPFKQESLGTLTQDDVEIEYGFTYRKSTIRQLKIRGSYGRYITFWGRSVNDYSGTPGYYNPGSPGSISCSTNSFGSTATTYCNRTGYIAPSYSPGTQGGTQKRWFEYQLDCRDRTYNRKGDISAGAFKKGWQDVYYDKTARAVAQKYCPRINSLPRQS